MSWAPYPTLWQHLKCRLFFPVDVDAGKNFRAAAPGDRGEA